MSNIKRAFAGGPIFIPFVTAGDPSLEVTARLVSAMDRAGAGVIELGIPFSDPVAEGPVIQAANQRALSAGATTDRVFEMVSEIRPAIAVPLVFLVYFNSVFAYGKERFLDRCREAGVDGLIVPDLPFEEKWELDDLCRKREIDLISLVAPTSRERVAKISGDSTGFVYCVSSLGVTGVREQIKTNLAAMVRAVKEATATPCAVGFGISRPEQAEEIAAFADGVIVGSAIVRLTAQYGAESEKPVFEYVREMSEAVRKGGKR